MSMKLSDKSAILFEQLNAPGSIEKLKARVLELEQPVDASDLVSQIQHFFELKDAEHKSAVADLEAKVEELSKPVDDEEIRQALSGVANVEGDKGLQRSMQRSLLTLINRKLEAAERTVNHIYSLIEEFAAEPRGMSVIAEYVAEARHELDPTQPEEARCRIGY